MLSIENGRKRRFIAGMAAAVGAAAAIGAFTFTGTADAAAHPAAADHSSGLWFTSPRSCRPPVRPRCS